MGNQQSNSSISFTIPNPQPISFQMSADQQQEDPLPSIPEIKQDMRNKVLRYVDLYSDVQCECEKVPTLVMYLSKTQQLKCRNARTALVDEMLNDGFSLIENNMQSNEQNK